VTAEREAAWFASLPTMYGAAAALFTDERGHVLLVKPNYRDHWSLPGGILEDGEPPRAGCAREVAEELGLHITPGELLTVDWVAPEGARPKPTVHWVYDGGTIPATTTVILQAEELDDYRFVDPADLPGYLPPVITARVAAALRARKRLGSPYVAIEQLGGCRAPRGRRGPYLRARLRARPARGTDR
jgi:ADP-ribose pyrophosphatase YjhB (NUDIX family)